MNARRFALIVGASVGYAALRYNVFAGVAWEEFPLYVANKGFSLAAITLVALSYLANRRMPSDAEGRAGRRHLARSAGLMGFALSVAHALISFSILNSARYPSLFEGGELNGAGLACLLSGALATALFALPAVYSARRLAASLSPGQWKRAQQLGYVGLALTAIHVLTVGVWNWWAISTWPGGLVPISLVSFLVCVVPIAAKAGAVGRASVFRPAADPGPARR